MELQMYLQAYLAELLSRYSECEETVAWLQEKQMQKSDFMAASLQQMQEGSPSFVWLSSRTRTRTTAHAPSHTHTHHHTRTQHD